jgi:hypothetical protein
MSWHGDHRGGSDGGNELTLMKMRTVAAMCGLAALVASASADAQAVVSVRIVVPNGWTPTFPRARCTSEPTGDLSCSMRPGTSLSIVAGDLANAATFVARWRAGTLQVTDDGVSHRRCVGDGVTYEFATALDFNVSQPSDTTAGQIAMVITSQTRTSDCDVASSDEEDLSLVGHPVQDVDVVVGASRPGEPLTGATVLRRGDGQRLGTTTLMLHRSIPEGAVWAIDVNCSLEGQTVAAGGGLAEGWSGAQLVHVNCVFPPHASSQ